MMVAPALGPSDSCGSRVYKAWQAKGLVHRPAFAEHIMVSPFCSLESEQRENCTKRSMTCRACCFCFFKKASKSAFRIQSRGIPPAHQWMHVGAVLQGFWGPWFSCPPDKPKLGKPSTVSVVCVDPMERDFKKCYFSCPQALSRTLGCKNETKPLPMTNS